MVIDDRDWLASWTKLFQNSKFVSFSKISSAWSVLATANHLCFQWSSLWSLCVKSSVNGKWNERYKKIKLISQRRKTSMFKVRIHYAGEIWSPTITGGRNVWMYPGGLGLVTWLSWRHRVLKLHFCVTKLQSRRFQIPPVWWAFEKFRFRGQFLWISVFGRWD